MIKITVFGGVYWGPPIWETTILDVQYGWGKVHGSSLRGLGFGD